MLSGQCVFTMSSLFSASDDLQALVARHEQVKSGEIDHVEAVKNAGDRNSTKLGSGLDRQKSGTDTLVYFEDDEGGWWYEEVSTHKWWYLAPDHNDADQWEELPDDYWASVGSVEQTMDVVWGGSSVDKIKPPISDHFFRKVSQTTCAVRTHHVRLLQFLHSVTVSSLFFGESGF